MRYFRRKFTEYVKLGKPFFAYAYKDGVTLSIYTIVSGTAFYFLPKSDPSLYSILAHIAVAAGLLKYLSFQIVKLYRFKYRLESHEQTRELLKLDRKIRVPRNEQKNLNK